MDLHVTFGEIVDIEKYEKADQQRTTTLKHAYNYIQDQFYKEFQFLKLLDQYKSSHFIYFIAAFLIL